MTQEEISIKRGFAIGMAWMGALVKNNFDRFASVADACDAIDTALAEGGQESISMYEFELCSEQARFLDNKKPTKTKITLVCPKCEHALISKVGRNKGHQRYQCKNCNHYFADHTAKKVSEVA